MLFGLSKSQQIIMYYNQSLLQLHLVGNMIQIEVFELGGQPYHSAGYSRSCVARFCRFLITASAKVIFVSMHDDRSPNNRPISEQSSDLISHADLRNAFLICEEVS